MEQHEASPSMEKFFENLLEIKAFVKEKHEETHNEILEERIAAIEAGDYQKAEAFQNLE